jgi:hypothetical protein
MESWLQIGCNRTAPEAPLASFRDTRARIGNFLGISPESARPPALCRRYGRPGRVYQHDFQPGALGVSLSKARCINRLSTILASFTSKTLYRAFVRFAEAIENMERERGLEPPASSLGKRISIVIEELGVEGALFWSGKSSVFNDRF